LPSLAAALSALPLPVFWPEPVKPAVEKPPETKAAAAQTARPPRIAKAPAADATATPAEDWSQYMPIALPVLTVIVLLIAVIVYRAKRASGKKTAQQDLPVEPEPVTWPPPPAGDNEQAPEASETLTAEENEPSEERQPLTEDLETDLDFQMEQAPAESDIGDDGVSPPTDVSLSDDGDGSTRAVSVYDQVMEIINRMSDVELTELLEMVNNQQDETSRQDDRLTFYTMVDYVVDGQYYRDFIQDLSVSGVFIKARQMFEPGQSVLMTFMSPYFQKPFKISGEIVRTLDTGIGIKFDTDSQVQAEAISALMDQIRKIEEAG
jgi:hypothetical protein